MNDDFEKNENIDTIEDNEDADASFQSGEQINDNQNNELNSSSFEEEYFPEQYNPNTSYGQYKMRQEQLQREAEAIKQRQLLREERNKKTTDEEKEEKDSNNLEKNGQPSSDKEETSKSDSNLEKKDDNKSKKENGLQSKIDKAGGKIDAAKSKINKVKQTANKVTHPVSAAKDEIKNKIKRKIVHFLIHWWWVVAIAAIVFLILLILLLIILGLSDSTIAYMLDPRYDITYTTVTSTNDYIDEEDKVELENYSLREYALGAAYYEFKDKLDGKTDSEKLEIYKSYFVVIKSILLSYGGYDSATKHLYIRNSYSEVPSCNINTGCNIYQDGAGYVFVSTSYEGEYVSGSSLQTIEAASASDIKLLMDAYDEVKYLLLIPKWFDAILTDYYIERPEFSESISNGWINSTKKYDKKIKDTSEYNDFKIYDLREYIGAYASGPSDAYWWPIGSEEAIDGIYGGEPIYTVITSKFSASRTIDGVTKAHYGVDIGKDGACFSNDYVIIASRPGVVVDASDGCPDATDNYANKYGCSSAGNYVKIDHGDGVITLYAHLRNGSVSVEEDQYVYQGQMLGVMGSSGSSTGCHLHFGVQVNGSYVDPLNYVSIDNPRPTSDINSYLNNVGNSNKQSVCYVLKYIFSNDDDAVAAVMTNIAAESSFDSEAIGDSGASYGLCQWRDERRTKLEETCGSVDPNTPQMIRCQLEEFMAGYELSSSYYSEVEDYLTSAASAEDKANYFCVHFEAPYDTINTCLKRAKGAAEMLEYVQNNCN